MSTKLIVIGVLIVGVIALVIGLSVGLTRKDNTQVGDSVPMTSFAPAALRPDTKDTEKNLAFDPEAIPSDPEAILSDPEATETSSSFF